ncbi:MAG: UDP-N-acetylmuramate dehydrogenase [Polyangiales bacterium]
MALSVARGEALGPRTTLGLGGAAACFVEAQTRDVVHDALAYAREHALPVHVLGGGSNLIVPDAGVSGLVLHVATRGVEVNAHHDHAMLTVEAGESWDALVARSVEAGLLGVECLTGIPGLVGATPIQNVGAYGQEVSEVIDAVEVLDRQTYLTAWLSARECGFGYRDSRFKREPERFVVLAVRFRLATSGRPTLRYPELQRAVAARSATPSLHEVVETVRALRASKGMLIDASFEPSAGSFFTNPVVSVREADDVLARARARGTIVETRELPRFDAGSGRVKLSAGWLIERAGIVKGLRRGPVGVSSLHALALVHHGGGTTEALMALADEVRQCVAAAFGVMLEIEPVRW